MKNVTVFASGKGSNAEAIIHYFQHHPSIRVSLVVTNNPSAGVIRMAHSHKIISAIVSKTFFEDENRMTALLGAVNTDLIVLAGFLQLVPAYLVRRYEGRMINIHPSLLPAFGGKGMYGQKVHQAVLAAGETKSGISIHQVSVAYDQGKILLQKDVDISAGETPETLAEKVLALEHYWLPRTIERLLA